MHVVVVDEARMLFVAPLFRVEVEAEDDVRLDGFIHETRPPADFADAVKKPLALLGHGDFCHRVVFLLEGIRSGGAELRRAGGGDRARFRACQEDLRAEGFQFRDQKLRDFQRHVALADRRGFSDPKPTLLHLRPTPPEVPGIEGDFQAGQRLLRIEGRQRHVRPPVNRCLPDRIGVRREFQNIRGVARRGGDHGGITGERNRIRPGPARRINLVQKSDEIRLRHRLLEPVQNGPFRLRGQRAQNRLRPHGKEKEGEDAEEFFQGALF